MYAPITIQPEESCPGPFAIELVTTDDSQGFVVVRRLPNGIAELYFVPSEPEDSELICVYVVALLNQLTAMFPQHPSLQVQH